MGLLDTIKGLFVKKDIMEQIKEYGEYGNTAKLVKLTAVGNAMAIRLAAIDSLKEIKMDDLCVTTLMSLLNEENKEIQIAAANSLAKVATKRELDVLRHKSELEQDEDIKKALVAASIEAKERTPRF